MPCLSKTRDNFYPDAVNAYPTAVNTIDARIGLLKASYMDMRIKIGLHM